MRHTADEVERSVAMAFARSTRQWVPDSDGDPTALQKCHADFVRVRIRPEIGEVEVELHASALLGVAAGMRPVWFITRKSVQRVFFDDSSRNFGVAWGPDSRKARYVDLGFRTADPIDAFLA